MSNPLSITIDNSPSLVSLSAELDSSDELVLSSQGTPLGDDNGHGLAIICAKQSLLPIRVEIIDFGPASSSWRMNAAHEQTSWARSADRCHFDWDETTSTETQVEVRATRAGVTKSKIIFIKVEPQGTKN